MFTDRAHQRNLSKNQDEEREGIELLDPSYADGQNGNQQMVSAQVNVNDQQNVDTAIPGSQGNTLYEFPYSEKTIRGVSGVQFCI